MAVRFGSQQHPSGGQRFGSQEYAAINAAAGDLHASETGADIFAADSYPRVTGSLGATDSGSDTLASSGTSSLLFTMQAHESSVLDGFAASGIVTINMGGYRFGSQAHPGGGLRFGSQSWAALGPSGSLVATESGSDGFATVGFLLGASYTFAAFDVLPSFVDYSSESIGAGVVGTLEAGNKVMLPVSAPGGISFSWETNEFGNPSLRLANLVGATIISNVPWYVWDGSAWTVATFDVSDAMQGAVFMTEPGIDIFSANAAQTRYGSAVFNEAGDDFLTAVVGVAVRGALAVSETGTDSLVASGALGYVGAMAAFEGAGDTLAVSGAVTVAGIGALIESATLDSFTAGGGLVSTGSLAAAEGASDSLSASGFLVNGGALAATESAMPDVASATGVVRVSGALTCIEGGVDTFSSTGRLDRDGQLSMVEIGGDALDIDGEVLVFGALSATDMPDTFASTGTRESTGDIVAAELAAIEGGADRFVSRGRLGDVIPLQTFDGPVNTTSGTRVVVVRSRRTAEAA